MDIYKKNKTLFKLAPNLADYDKVYKDFDWEKVYGELEWFEDHKINAAYNAVDRHLKTHRKNKVALFFEDEKGDKQKYTFEELANISSKIGNYLKTLGVDRGDRVFIFLPRIPYLYFSFLAVLKIGAIAGTLFSAFYEDALFDRLRQKF